MKNVRLAGCFERRSLLHVILTGAVLCREGAAMASIQVTGPRGAACAGRVV